MRSPVWRTVSILLQGSLAFPLVGAAQGIGFESLFKDINDVSLFFGCWNTRSAVSARGDCPFGKSSFGIEVLYDLGTLSAIDLEFALGYSQFTGFRSSDPSFELLGAVRELPSVSMYGTVPLPLEEMAPGKWLKHLLNERVSFYVGLRSGLIQLNNVQIVDTLIATSGDTLVVYSGSAVAFQFGVESGLVINLGSRFHLFGAIAYHSRRFPSVVWATTGTNKVPAAFPRTLDFTGLEKSIGLQVTLRQRKPDTTSAN